MQTCRLCSEVAPRPAVLPPEAERRSHVISDCKWFNVKAFLKDRLVAERGVGGGDEICESVVFAEPYRVHRLQAGVLVGALVAREELILKEE